MALPIKNTPILRGEDAVEFMKHANNPVKVSKEKRKIIKEHYLKIKNLFKDK